MKFDRQDVYFNVYTNFSIFRVVATHVPTDVYIAHEEEYTGDVWGRAKDRAVDLLEEELMLGYKRKERKKKNEGTGVSPQ